MAETPWMTVKETAAYTKRHPKTVERALREYQLSHGRRGLRGVQAAPNCQYRITRDDAERWMTGETPKRRVRLS